MPISERYDEEDIGESSGVSPRWPVSSFWSPSNVGGEAMDVMERDLS